MISVAAILSLLRELASASRAREYSRERYLYTTLLDMEARLPSWLVPADIEPVAAVEKELQCGSMYSISGVDDNLVLVVRDHDGEVMAPVLSATEGEQLRDDLARVLAAVAGKERAA